MAMTGVSPMPAWRQNTPSMKGVRAETMVTRTPRRCSASKAASVAALNSLFSLRAVPSMSQATSLMPSSGRSGRRKSAGCSPIAILLAVKEAPASVEFSADTGA